jgi:uncharacterized repeat protein (TIGR03803 family)
MSKMNWGKRPYAVLALFAATAMALPAQTFTTLHSFDGGDGENPQIAVLVQGIDGNLYGTMPSGGAYSGGTVFKITPSGTFTTIYNFCSQSGCSDGKYPLTGLVQTTNGDFYGETFYGGSKSGANCVEDGCGTVFKITPRGTLTTLYNFCSQSGCTDGENPMGTLVNATNGYFYGTTYAGGADGQGTVFKISPSGKLATLYSFCSQSGCMDGEWPEAGLVQATNGDFYGTTVAGGANSCIIGGTNSGCGTIFKITPSGTLTTLHNFCSQSGCTDGSGPIAGLVQATNGNLYGMTNSGGAKGDGTVFKIAPSGGSTFKTLYSFCSQSGCTDGESTRGGLVQAANGDLYGTTLLGGANGGGTVFKISPSGKLTTLYSFCSQSGCADGDDPWAGLVQATNGDFYGTTSLGGTYGTYYGTVFSQSVGLGSFVETRPTSGVAGRLVEILGTDLTGATTVTFNGTPAAFTVVSPTLITTTVPTGATTGTVQVVTPSGALMSNVPFRVLP